MNSTLTIPLIDEIESEYTVAMKKCAIGNYDKRYKFVPLERNQLFSINKKLVKK